MRKTRLPLFLAFLNVVPMSTRAQAVFRLEPPRIVVESSGVPVYDVKAFGARCDGVTDDTTAIGAAYTVASKSTGGGIVHFPHSTGPCVFSTLTVPAGSLSTGWIVSVFDNGLLGTQIKVSSFDAFIGHSGSFQSLSGNFDMAPNATWEQRNVTSDTPLVDVTNLGSVYFEGINMAGTNTSETMHIHDTLGAGAVGILLVNCQVQNAS